MTTLGVRFEAAEFARRQERNRAALLWLVAHLGAVMQVAGAGVFVAGVGVLVGSLAGAVYGATAVMLLVGPLMFAWGLLREGGKI